MRCLEGWLGLSVPQRLKAMTFSKILFPKIESRPRHRLWKLSAVQQQAAFLRHLDPLVGEACGQTGHEYVAGLVVPGRVSFTSQRGIKAASG
jgi:hypothetical protein